MSSVPKEIFKAYDIRGIVGKTLTDEIVEAIGHAIGSEAVARKTAQHRIGRDGRFPPRVRQGARARHPEERHQRVDVGMVATPMTYFRRLPAQDRLRRDENRHHNPPTTTD